MYSQHFSEHLSSAYYLLGSILGMYCIIENSNIKSVCQVTVWGVRIKMHAIIQFTILILELFISPPHCDYPTFALLSPTLWLLCVQEACDSPSQLKVSDEHFKEI